MRRRSRGLTLLELLVTLAIVGILTVAISTAYGTGIDIQERMLTDQSSVLKLRAFEDRLTDLLKHAHLATDANQTSSFFVGSVGNGTDAQSTSGSGLADTVVFTAAGTRLSGPVLNSDDDFETQNQTYGPQGGIGEYAISTSPVGQPSDQSGLFIREQRPADGDPTQGGYESVMEPNVESIQFEFFDGTDWLETWDTRTMTTARLPAAVRVTYRLQNEDKDHILVIQIPASDVTPVNPVTIGGT